MLRQSIGDMSLGEEFDDNMGGSGTLYRSFGVDDMGADGALFCSFGDGEEGYGEHSPERKGIAPPAFALLETREVYEELVKKAKDAGEIFNLSPSTAIQVLSRIQVGGCWFGLILFYFIYLSLFLPYSTLSSGTLGSLRRQRAWRGF